MLGGLSCFVFVRLPMERFRMIFFFSGTGNSEYVALRIARACGERVVDIENFDPSRFGVDDWRVLGVVSATHTWGPAAIMVDFLRDLRLPENADVGYSFCVSTCGTTSGASGRMADQELRRSCGFGFDAFFDVKMPDTWTPLFDLSDAEKVAKTNERAEPEIDEIIERVSSRSKGDFQKRRMPTFISRAAYRVMYPGMRNTSAFTAGEECTGCGLCARQCPSGAIEMHGERPVWAKSECTICMRCLHSCPVFAIQRGRATRAHGQYLNPNVGREL